MLNKHQLCLKLEKELRELRGSSMRLHRKIGTANMDKLLYKMWNNGLSSGKVHQLFGSSGKNLNMTSPKLKSLHD
ncbi:hypothetical protein T07_10100 [Trichinella nelsoni]|uniref:Uncharacterized protein n=1 Tax=Trichinella nelsoni TaxID=6336 RepID=A0A0V0RXA7_9BILA|nr:hypothetical protein T07_10100 [Trichinella nelsoni]